MQFSIPDALAALLPFVATILSSWLGGDKLKPSTNAIIALVAILVTAVVCAFLADGIIPGAPGASLIAVLSYVGILMRGDLSVLYQYLQKRPSPVTGSDTATSTQTVTTNAYEPKAIPFPPKQPPAN